MTTETMTFAEGLAKAEAAGDTGTFPLYLGLPLQVEVSYGHRTRDAAFQPIPTEEQDRLPGLYYGSVQLRSAYFRDEETHVHLFTVFGETRAAVEEEARSTALKMLVRWAADLAKPADFLDYSFRATVARLFQ